MLSPHDPLSGALKQDPTPGLLVLELELLLADLRETKRLLLQLDRQPATQNAESRSPNLGYTTKGTLQEPPLRDLLFQTRLQASLGLWVEDGVALAIKGPVRCAWPGL